MTNIVKVLTSEAPVIFKNLNGLICIHKPAQKSLKTIRQIIAKRLCEELNELHVRPPSPYVSIVGDTSKKLKVSVKPNLADHPAVVGPRYIPDELRVNTVNHLGFNTSGVAVLGLLDGGREMAEFLKKACLLRTYLIKGRLGEARDNHFAHGRLLFRGRYDYITRYSADKAAATMQALYRKLVFELCAIDGRSQTAYEWASQGLLRPFKTGAPVIYGVKCVDFSPPEFTLEIQCVNETEEYLTQFISEYATKLRTAAVCTQIKCIRFSHFDIDAALLPKHWELQCFVDSMKDNSEKFWKIKEMVSHMLVNVESEKMAQDELSPEEPAIMKK